MSREWRRVPRTAGPPCRTACWARLAGAGAGGVGRGERAKWEHNENADSPSHSPSKRSPACLSSKQGPAIYGHPPIAPPASAPPPPPGAVDPCPEPLQSQNANYRPPPPPQQPSASPGRPGVQKKIRGRCPRSDSRISDAMTPTDAHDLHDSGMGGRKRDCEIGV